MMSTEFTDEEKQIIEAGLNALVRHQPFETTVKAALRFAPILKKLYAKPEPQPEPKPDGDADG